MRDRLARVLLLVPAAFCLMGLLAAWVALPNMNDALRGVQPSAGRAADPAPAREALRFRSDSGATLYAAGLPRFRSNFVRDGVIAALLANDVDALRDQLRHAAAKQGTRRDGFSGEEPGKIPHEDPPVELNGHSTLYSACDTTALFVIGAFELLRWTAGHPLTGAHSAAADPGALGAARPPASQLAQSADWRWLRPHVQRAVAYIGAHVGQDGLFAEDPALAGAERFALDVTYWKDSHLLVPDPPQPQTRIAYTLAHVQSAAAVRLAAQMDPDLTDALALHRRMLAALPTLVDERTGLLYAAVAYDRDPPRKIATLSSDSLHALFYLQPSELPPRLARTIQAASMRLATLAGFATQLSTAGGTAEGVGGVPDAALPYHAANVWPFEQAIIHRAAVTHGLAGAAAVAALGGHVLLRLPAFPELLRLATPPHPALAAADFDVDAGLQISGVSLLPAPGKQGSGAGAGAGVPVRVRAVRAQRAVGVLNRVAPRSRWTQEFRLAGCDPQLWTVAARDYFAKALQLQRSAPGASAPLPAAPVSAPPPPPKAVQQQQEQRVRQQEQRAQQQEQRVRQGQPGQAKDAASLQPQVAGSVAVPERSGEANDADSAAVPERPERPNDADSAGPNAAASLQPLPSTPRGVAASQLSAYQCVRDPPVWRCRDGSATLRCDMINDDFCDCADGSDEPGTAACAGTSAAFACEVVPPPPRARTRRLAVLPASRVDDGVCDCCDGSDEPAGTCGRHPACSDGAPR